MKKFVYPKAKTQSRRLQNDKRFLHKYDLYKHKFVKFLSIYICILE